MQDHADMFPAVQSLLSAFKKIWTNAETSDLLTFMGQNVMTPVHACFCLRLCLYYCKKEWDYV